MADSSRREFIKKSLVAGAAVPILGTAALSANGATPKRKSRRRSKRVLVITFDGIRTDGLQEAYTPNIDSIIAGGALSMNTRDVMPSITMPNYTSILTGSDPEITGVTDNKWLISNHKLPPLTADEDGYYPSVFKVLKDGVPDIKTSFFWNWEPLINPFNRKYIDTAVWDGILQYPGLFDKAFEFMESNREVPTFTFLYTVHTDHVGHDYAWMSKEYIKSIEEGDVQVGILLDKMKAAGIYDDTHIFFITDHGGINKGHGKVSKEEMIVPWAVQGPGIKRGFTITEDNFTKNTASLIVDLFGLEQPAEWTGKVPESIYEGSRR